MNSLKESKINKCKICKKLFIPEKNRGKNQLNCGSRKYKRGCAYKCYKLIQRNWIRERRSELIRIEKKYYKLLSKIK